YDVVALGKRKGEIAGVQIETEPLHYNDLHTVTLYVNADNQKSLYDYILSLKPKRVIFNPGTENAEFYKILNENGISFETACTLVLLPTNQDLTHKTYQFIYKKLFVTLFRDSYIF